jgi:hypothetical protein
MRKTLSKPETHIVMRVDREAGVIDLRVFAANLRRGQFLEAGFSYLSSG